MVEKLAGTRHGAHAFNDTLNVGQLQAMTFEQIEPEAHQLVVIGFVTRGAGQFGDAGSPRKFNPDFRDQHTFKIETDDLHEHAPVKRRLEGFRSASRAL